MSNTEVQSSAPSPWQVDPDTLVQLRIDRAHSLLAQKNLHAAFHSMDPFTCQWARRAFLNDNFGTASLAGSSAV